MSPKRLGRCTYCGGSVAYTSHGDAGCTRCGRPDKAAPKRAPVPAVVRAKAAKTPDCRACGGSSKWTSKGDLGCTRCGRPVKEPNG